MLLTRKKTGAGALFTATKPMQLVLERAKGFSYTSDYGLIVHHNLAGVDFESGVSRQSALLFAKRRGNEHCILQGNQVARFLGFVQVAVPNQGGEMMY